MTDATSRIDLDGRGAHGEKARLYRTTKHGSMWVPHAVIVEERGGYLMVKSRWLKKELERRRALDAA